MVVFVPFQVGLPKVDVAGWVINIKQQISTLVYQIVDVQKWNHEPHKPPACLINVAVGVPLPCYHQPELSSCYWPSPLSTTTVYHISIPNKQSWPLWILMILIITAWKKWTPNDLRLFTFQAIIEHDGLILWTLNNDDHRPSRTCLLMCLIVIHQDWVFSKYDKHCASSMIYETNS